MTNTAIRLILSRFIGKVANLKLSIFSSLLVRSFKAILNIDDDIDRKHHNSLNNYFTRKKAGYQHLPKSPREFFSPAEGVISQYGNIEESTLVQAKGRFFNLHQLFGGAKELSKEFEHGTFFTVYLAPHNYHRVHLPREGTLTKILYLGGDLHSVSKKNSERIDNLYCKNERAILYFETENSQSFALILVGALLVGSITLTCMDDKVPVHKNYPKNRTVSIDPVHLTQLSEVGMFNFGSTVICVTSKDSLNLIKTVGINPEIKVGQTVGYLSA